TKLDTGTSEFWELVDIIPGSVPADYEAFTETVLGRTRIQTPYGWTKIGANNASYTHFDTDRASFYFYKPVHLAFGAYIPTRYGGYTGAPSSTIFAISPSYPTYGLFYSSGSPDRIQLKWNGAIKRQWNFETGSVEILPVKSGPSLQPRVYRDVACYSEMGPDLTGWMKVVLPQTWTNTMIQFKVEGYDYSTRGAWGIVVSGYNYLASATWINPRVDVLYGIPPFVRVRFGVESSGKCSIMLGEGPDTVWQYPNLIIFEVIAGYSQVEDWDDGWVISRTTSLAGFTTKKSVSFSTGMSDLNKSWMPCAFEGEETTATINYKW
ncbi:unnamed protein product, partial [marine sediment metagenome]